jgi:hypothetical protein
MRFGWRNRQLAVGSGQLAGGNLSRLPYIYKLNCGKLDLIKMEDHISDKTLSNKIVKMMGVVNLPKSFNYKKAIANALRKNYLQTKVVDKITTQQ